MRKISFDYIRDNGLLLFEAIRGSKCHGTNTPSSDTDIVGVYVCPTEDVLGLGLNYEDQISNETNDVVWYEIGKFLKLLCNSNPTVLETLFIDDEFVLYEHPIFTELKKHKDIFVTKRSFKASFSYAHSQIAKARGLNKLFVNPTTEKKGPLDFCYTFHNQGSTKLVDWLANRGLDQKYCGLVNVPNMHNMYGVYYDWMAQIEDNKWDILELSKEQALASVSRDYKITPAFQFLNTFLRIVFEYNVKALWDKINEHLWKIGVGKRLGYSGIVAEDGSSNTLRYIQDNYTEKDGVMLNSVAKGQEPICYMSFNADGYAKHLRDYTRYQKWLKERNPERYELNKQKNYDAKNMSECFRLMNMAIEMANGEGVKVNRKNIDREFLLDVKHHKYEYDELLPMLEEREKLMHDAAEKSNLPEEVDEEKVNEILISIRKEFNT